MEEEINKKESRLTADERILYYELHQAARSYNTKLWTIPALFILVVGFILKEIVFDSLIPLLSLKNSLLLIGGGFVIFMLLVQSLKDSFFQISIQKRINQLEEKMLCKTFPIYSATDIEITKRLQELKETSDSYGEKVDFSVWRDCLSRLKESKIFFKITIFSLILILIGIISMIIKASYLLLK